jgi:beta-mannosidase
MIDTTAKAICALGLLCAVVANSFAAGDSPPLAEGKFGQAIVLKDLRSVVVPFPTEMNEFPIAFDCWFKLDSAEAHNILMAKGPKHRFGVNEMHWELFSTPGEGRLSLYIPQIAADENIGLSKPVADGQWHFASVRFDEKSVSLFVDGELVTKREHTNSLRFDDAPLVLGHVPLGSRKDPSWPDMIPLLGFDGLMDDVHIHRPRGDAATRADVPQAPAAPSADTLWLLSFDEISENGVLTSAAKEGTGTAKTAQMTDRATRPLEARFLDDVQDELFSKSSLVGDTAVERDAQLPVTFVQAEPLDSVPPLVEPERISLAGEWRMKGSTPHIDEKLGHPAKDSAGVEAGWHKPGFDRSDWFEVSVPTTVQAALLKLGEIPDPLVGSNTIDELEEFGVPKDVPWSFRHTRIEQQDWYFAREFVVPEAWKGRPVRLHFDGIDYGGSVYLNGSPLGYHAGMFGGPTREVSKLLNFGKSNLLVVRIDRAPNHWSGRLKGAAGWGWHYGHLISMGIWRDVTLEALPALEVTEPFVVTRKIDGDQAELEVEYAVINGTDEPIEVEVDGLVKGANFTDSSPTAFRNRVLAWPGKSRWKTKLVLPAARLWWPMNYGAQNLYHLQLTPRMAAGPQKGESGATRQTRFGIRTIEMLPAKGALPEYHYRWQFVVNGRPMFIKGANWCWSDPMLECDPAKYERLLELVRRSGVQLLRAWGGGIIETDTFYDKCDEKGIMVYQEFPFNWGPPDFPGTNPHMVDDQVDRVVKRLRNHPSLVMWGGGNENVRKEPNSNDEGLFLVGRRCRQLDPSRPFHRTSPWGGSSHPWTVFHGAGQQPGQPMEYYHRFHTPFLGEYGIPSMANLSSSLKFLAPDELERWPMDDNRKALVQAMHQFSSRDPIKVLRYSDYGPVKDWPTYIEYSQMAQGDWLRFAAEGQRSRSGEDKTGFTFYAFSELFPGHSWAVVDYYGSPKLAYYRARQTLKPRIAFAVSPKFDWGDGEKFQAVVHVANDTSETMPGGKVTATVYGSDLNEAWTKDFDFGPLGPDERRELGAVETVINPAVSKPFLLAVALRDEQGKMLSDQWYWYNCRQKTAAVKEVEKLEAGKFTPERIQEAYEAYANVPPNRLKSLPRTNLEAVARSEGGQNVLHIRNTGDRVAFNVLIENFPDGYADFLDDNSFSLRPGEERLVAYELAKEMKLPDTVWVRAWNADAVRVQ